MLAAIARGEDTFNRDITPRRLDHIVVGVDFSEVSLAAAQWVGRHLAGDAALTLVHVIEPPPLPNISRLGSGRIRDLESRLQVRIESLRGALHGLSRVVGSTGIGVEVRVGDPALQIAAYADTVDADLIVIGGNPVSRTALRLETATTDRLLRRLARPGLVARSVHAAPTTVLAALADDIASPVLTAAQMVAVPWAARVATLRLADRTAVAKRQQVQMILDVARKQRADVIVIGCDGCATDGDDDAARLLARTANCSVLVVPHADEARPRRALPLDVMRRGPEV